MLFFAFGNAIEIENANFGTIFWPKNSSKFLYASLHIAKKKLMKSMKVYGYLSCQLKAIIQIQKWWFDILWMILIRFLWWQLIVVLFSNFCCKYVFAISLILKCYWNLMKLKKNSWQLNVNIWIQRWQFDIFWMSNSYKVMIALNVPF